MGLLYSKGCPDPPGAQYYEGSCYFKVFLPGHPMLSADDADELCHDKDGHLAIITNEVENTIVSDTADLKEAWIGAIRDPSDPGNKLMQNSCAISTVSM